MRADVIIIGGGQQDAALATRLLEAGKKVLLIFEGRKSEDRSREEFRVKGGSLLAGDKVCRVDWAEDGSRVEAIYTEGLEDTALRAEAYVLCSGRFFTRGLLSEEDRVWEPVFGVDVKYLKDSSQWCDPDFFAPQPFESFGVIPSKDCKALKDGKEIENLYVTGDILCDGIDNTEELCKRII